MYVSIYYEYIYTYILANRSFTCERATRFIDRPRLRRPHILTRGGSKGVPPLPAYQQLSRARNACAESSSGERTKLKHGTKLGRTLCYFSRPCSWLRPFGLYRNKDNRPAPQMLNRYSRIRVTHPQEYGYRIPPILTQYMT